MYRGNKYTKSDEIRPAVEIRHFYGIWVVLFSVSKHSRPVVRVHVFTDLLYVVLLACFYCYNTIQYIYACVYVFLSVCISIMHLLILLNVTYIIIIILTAN